MSSSLVPRPSSLVPRPSPSSFVLMCVGLGGSASSSAGVTASCNNGGNAPAFFDGNACNSACSQTGSKWECDLAAMGCGNSLATVVQDFNNTGNHDFSAWGTCSGVGNWCCVFDDAGATVVEQVVLTGTAGNDDLFFHNTVTGDNLEPQGAWDLLGFIHGMGGNDSLTGSDYVGGDYRDNLYGDDDNDLIVGGADKDWIDGGAGDDELRGQDGNDRILGGPGDDLLYGAAGHDVLCDTADDGAAGCVTNGATFFDSDVGADSIWYDGEATCPGSPMNANSTSGNQQDSCGDSAWGPGQLPLSCENPVLTAEPAECVDPN